MKNEVKEPLIRIVKRDSISKQKSLLIYAVALLLSLVASGLVIFALTKLNPAKVYVAMFEGAFGTERRTWVMIRDTMLLLCIGIGLAPAFRMRFWNIGAEGQILVGAIATAACMIYFDNLPNGVLLILMAACSIVAGAVWGFVPAVFKARFGTNETLFTLMMNYVAIQLTSFFVSLWENPYGSNSVGIINRQTNAGWFPEVFSQQYMLNVIIVMTLTVLMYIYMRYTKQGYEIAVVGESENTAKYAGIKVSNVLMRTMAVSGGVCGLAGFIAVAGASHTISVSTAGGRGFTAIIIAWLSKFNTFVMIAVAALLVFLDKGAIEIASRFDLNSYASQMVTGIILFFLLGSEFFINYRVILRHGKGKGAAK